MAKIAVVGAGLSGLTVSYRLQRAGHQAEVFERYPKPGGLARVLEVGGEPLEAFYHHLFTTDTSYVALAEELGLGDSIEWLPSRMGIWADGRLWDFGTPASLLRFKPLPMISKIRFALSTLLLQHTHDPKRFESVSAVEWIRRHQGEAVLRNIWGPLLHQKFSHMAGEVAMVWLWGKLYLRGRSRSKSGMGERLGYMRGSFARLVNELGRRIEEGGGRLHLSDAVRRIDRHDEGFDLTTRNGHVAADKVVVAASIPDHLEIAGHLLDPDDADTLGQLKATGAICTILELKHSLSPYYWLNIADSDMPFGGLIEHTNYIPSERYGGRTLLYISNYLFPDDALYKASKSAVLDAYLPALQKINPDFNPSWVTRSHHFRADYAQPVVTTDYRLKIPSVRSTVPGLYLCSMAQIYPEDRGQNYAIAYGDKVAGMVIEDLGGG